MLLKYLSHEIFKLSFKFVGIRITDFDIKDTCHFYI